MRNVILLLWTFCAIVYPVVSVHTCNYEQIKKRDAKCRRNTGFTLFNLASNANTILRACRDGRMQRYANCIKKMARECGIAGMYDFEKPVNAVAMICRDFKALDLEGAKQCFEEKLPVLQGCNQRLNSTYNEYITSDDRSSDREKVVCSLYGGMKQCLKGSFEPCSKNVKEHLVEFINAFAPDACQKYKSCVVCAGADTIKTAGLLMSIILVVKQALA